MRKITALKIIKNYIIELEFDDTKICKIDFQNKLKKGELYQRLNDYNFFTKVSVSSNGRFIYWGDEIELCADALWYEATNEKFNIEDQEAS